VPANNITVFPTSHSSDFSASSCRYSLCALWIRQWKEGHSYVFSRWISRNILRIPCDKFYSVSHCTYQSHISGPLHTPCGATPQGQVLLNSRRHSLAEIDTLLFHSALNSPFPRSSIPVHTPQQRFTVFYFILHSIPPPLSEILNSHRRTSVWIVAAM